MDKSVGYRGIRIDGSWGSGEFSGRLRWYSKTTEDTLTGTWGWYTSYTNGGKFALKRIE